MKSHPSCMSDQLDMTNKAKQQNRIVEDGWGKEEKEQRGT